MMKHLGDITKICGSDITPVDCITGGSPCQDLSVAGKRAGLSGERSGLFMEQIRIVKEMRQRDKDSGRTGLDIRPRYMVWENVPGAFSSNNGQDFRAVLEEIIRIVEPESPDVPALEKGKKWTKAGCIYDELGGWSVAWRLHDAQFWGVPQRRKRIALVTDFGGLTAPEILFERESLSGDSESGEKERETVTGSAGKSVSDTVPIVAGFLPNAGSSHGIDWEAQKSSIITANQRIGVYDARGNGNGEICPTITGDHQNRITDYTAICVGNGQLNQISMAEQANTLDTMHDQQAVLVTGSVRRLTPMECERLQGFPDGWTDIGEWVDRKGKKRKLADTPRYKALGNSIALPFWYWLLERISAQYKQPATLGSLFDGIGGFPLCWERINGPGTAIWASEVEEFPIAVTKYHFPEDRGGGGGRDT